MSKKYIRVENKVVEVTEEIYREYYKMDRQERYQVERDREKGTFSYNSLDLDDMQGEELLHDPQQKTIEDQIELKYMMQALGRALTD